jgi:hypothetical protein
MTCTGTGDAVRIVTSFIYDFTSRPYNYFTMRHELVDCSPSLTAYWLFTSWLILGSSLLILVYLI